MVRFYFLFPTRETTSIFQFEETTTLARILDNINVAAFDFAVSRMRGDFALVKFADTGLRGFGLAIDWLNNGTPTPLALDTL